MELRWGFRSFRWVLQLLWLIIFKEQQRHSHYYYKSFSWGTNANKQEDCFIVFVGVVGSCSCPQQGPAGKKMQTFSIRLQVACFVSENENQISGKSCWRANVTKKWIYGMKQHQKYVPDERKTTTKHIHPQLNVLRGVCCYSLTWSGMSKYIIFNYAVIISGLYLELQPNSQ